MDNEYHPQDDEARLWLEHLERKASALENRITQLEQVIQRAGEANNPLSRAIGASLAKEARMQSGRFGVGHNPDGTRFQVPLTREDDGA